MATSFSLADGGTIGSGNATWTFDDTNDDISTTVNVGIGKTSPGSPLHIRGPSAGYTVLAMEQNDYTGQDQGGYFDMRWNGNNSYNWGGNNYSDWNLDVYMQLGPWGVGKIGSFVNTASSSHVFFTGQHRNIMNTSINETSTGLIACSTGSFVNSDNSLLPSINESLPICILSTTNNDKNVFGVISDKEDSNDTRSSIGGSYRSISRKQNKNEQRLFINSVGEGAIWICNKNGTIEKGDYISSTTVTGYGGKQSDNILHNYTVAKITCDCDFNLTKIVKHKLKVNTITETKTRDVYEDVEKTDTKTEIVYDNVLQKYVQKTTTETNTTSENVFDTVDLYNEAGVVIGTHQVQRTESYTQTYTDIDYDANGDVQYEDDLDTSGNPQMVYPLETRFLQSDGTLLVDETDYTTRLANGESVYIACFVGCTYHCG